MQEKQAMGKCCGRKYVGLMMRWSKFKIECLVTLGRYPESRTFNVLNVWLLNVLWYWHLCTLSGSQGSRPQKCGVAGLNTLWSGCQNVTCQNLLKEHRPCECGTALSGHNLSHRISGKKQYVVLSKVCEWLVRCQHWVFAQSHKYFGRGSVFAPQHVRFA
jgi:hypothetical protein